MKSKKLYKVIAVDETGNKLLLKNKLGDTTLYTVLDTVELSNRVVVEDINSFPCKIEEDIFTKI